MNTKLEQILQDFHRAQADLAQVQSAGTDAEGMATNADGLVSVRLGPGGRITELTIRDQALRKYSGAELSDQVVGTITEATTRLNEALLDGYRSVLGPQFDPTTVAEGLADLESVLKSTSRRLFDR